MSVTLVVLVATAVAAAIVWALSLGAGPLDPIDPAAEQLWLIRWLREHPRWGRAARSIDQRVTGGLMLVIALVAVLGGALAVGAIYDMVERGSGIARWDRAVADWGSGHATEWSTRLLDLLTDLGGMPYVAAITLVIAAIDYRRFRNPNVPLFLAVVLVGISVLNNALESDRRPRSPRRGAPRGDVELVVPLGALCDRGSGLVRVCSRGGSAHVASATARSRPHSQPSSRSPSPPRARCSACTGSPTCSRVSSSAGCGSCSQRSRSADGCSAWASRPARVGARALRWALQRPMEHRHVTRCARTTRPPHRRRAR